MMLLLLENGFWGRDPGLERLGFAAGFRLWELYSSKRSDGRSFRSLRRRNDGRRGRAERLSISAANR
jgi:hypothetical protein